MAKKIKKTTELAEFIREDYFTRQKQHTLAKIKAETERQNTLRLILNHYLNSSDYSLEYLLVQDWIKQFKEAKKNFLAAAQKPPYRGLKDSFNLWLFFLKKKMDSTKTQTKKQIAAKPQMGIWAVNIIFSFILAVSASLFAPSLTKIIISPIDKITIYPITKISQFIGTSPAAKTIKKETKPINQKVLAEFIKKHHKEFKLENKRTNQVYTLTIEDLFGQVAGAEEKAKPSASLLELSIKEASADKKNRGISGYLKLLVKKIGEKQVELSKRLEEKLKRCFK